MRFLEQYRVFVQHGDWSALGDADIFAHQWSCVQIFDINERNVYTRGPLFMLKNLLEVILMADGFIIVIIWIKFLES